MELYGSKASPFAQRVLLTLRWKGQKLPFAPMPGGTMRSPDYQAMAPMGRVPLLVDGDLTLCESGAIAGYLDDVLPGPAFAPADPQTKARHAAIVSLLESEICPALRHYMVQRVFRMMDAPVLLEAAQAALAKALGAIERVRRPGDVWMVGDTPGPADALFVPVLALETVIGEGGDTPGLLSGHPGIDAYHAHVKADPVAGQTLAEIREGFAAMRAAAAAAASAG